MEEQTKHELVYGHKFIERPKEEDLNTCAICNECEYEYGDKWQEDILLAILKELKKITWNKKQI